MTQATALKILKLGHTIFLTGAAGAGKSYVIREYIAYLKRHGIRYAVTASTGIASTHINGTTIHSWSGIGIKQKLHAYDLDSLEEKQNLHKRWNEVQVLVIDEVSMLHASFVDMLDKVGKHLRRSDKPFGGIQVIFTGDFFQLPPVVRFGDEYENKEVFAFTSSAWKEAKPVICYLTEQFRQEDDRLTSILYAIRQGDVEEGHYEMLKNTHDKVHTDDHIKLYTHNENVDEINMTAFNKIQGEEKSYHMITKGKAQLVTSLKNNCLAEEVLHLKIGAKVICIKNAQDKSYVNGSLGVVISFDKESSPIVELTNGKKIAIKADSWKIEEDGKIKAELQQLPLKLAWAITVHKSQGMTIDKAEIDLSRSFVSGQGYVALSRLRSLDGLYLKGINPKALMIAEQVREADTTFRSRSHQAERAITKYSLEQLEILHNKFLTEHGGTLAELDESEIGEVEIRSSSHEKTKDMLKNGLTLTEIAEVRSLSVDTIIGHVEKLREFKEEIKLSHTLPPKKTLELIKKTFKKLDTRKLTPVYEHLQGKCSYQDIRLVRAYLNL